jgi:hypothetical protein
MSGGSMIHERLRPKPEDLVGKIALKALETVKSTQTRKSGSITVHNADGTKTISGAVLGTDETGTARSSANWVGDTTPPGIPTGITAWSGDGAVHVSWDGTLTGGIPADFCQVNLLVDGVAFASLNSAGSATYNGASAGTTVQVTATAEDDVCAIDGTAAHNVSPPCDGISVEVTDVAKDAATITITSTHGLVFKDSAISTTLMVIVFQPGGGRIEDQAALTAAFGATARIEWGWQREDEDGWSTILSTDSRLSDDGFSFTVSPADVDARTSFEASVVVD